MTLRPRCLSLVTFFALLPSCSASGGGDSIGVVESRISRCGPTPHAAPCYSVFCDGDGWDIEPLPAGARCGTGGKCDGNGTCVAGPPPPPPTPRVMDFTAAEVTELEIDSENTATVVYETANCSAGADPVLHFLKPNPSTGDRTEVAVDDNGAGGVNARMSAPESGGGIAWLIIRAHSDAYGTCDIHRNGNPWKWGVAVGGKTINIVGASVNDAVETVSMPQGSQYQALYRLSGNSITGKFRSGSGTNLSARAVLDAANASFLVHGVGPTRIVVNDVQSDSDGDGLGDRVEAQLGTCSTTSGVVAGFNCGQIDTAKDTDGDGISDAWEVLGKRDVSPHQPLAYWGANPRHKDLFIELDFLDDGYTPLRMQPAAAHDLGAYWQDTIEATTAQVQANHAALLHNPDGLPGVNMHIDSGLPPPPGAPASDYTLYGSWGGYDLVPAGSNYGTAWRTHMSPARRGVFHWGLGTRGGGGQTSGFAVTGNIYSGAAIAHELGHTMGLEHYGADSAGALNCKPQYASLMNYAYSYTGVGFSDGTGPGPLNDNALTEYGGLAGAPNPSHYADLYENYFGYYVDRSTWSVDFDRDGFIAPSGTLIRAYANNVPGGNCEGVRERRTALTTGGTTTHSPAVVRIKGQIAVLSATDAGIDVHLGADTYFNCNAPGGGNGDNPCGTFGFDATVGGGPVEAIDAVNLTAFNADPLILYAAVDASSTLRTGFLSVGTNSVSLTQTGPAQLAIPGVVGEPVLLSESPSLVLLVYKDASGTLYQSYYEANLGWTAPVPAPGTNGPFQVSDAPGLVLGRMPGDTMDAIYLQATHNITGSYQSTLVKLGSDSKWAPTPFFLSPAASRPGLAYVPSGSGSDRGKLYSVYTDSGKVLRMSTSAMAVTTASNGTITRRPTLFSSTFDNVWATGHGVDAMFEQGSDTNVRAVIVYDFGGWNGKPVFQPLADGIVNANYYTYNDWAQIGEKACAAIANPGNTVANPIPCF